MKKDLNNCLSCPKFKEEMSHKSGPAWDIASDMRQFAEKCFNNGCRMNIQPFEKVYSTDEVVDILTFVSGCRPCEYEGIDVPCNLSQGCECHSREECWKEFLKHYDEIVKGY